MTQKPASGVKAAAATASNSSAQPIVITTPPPTSANDDATYLRQTNGVLMRVFFASGGRSIVRPDDGLSRLANEAMNAQQIRITGYTDNLGKASTNSALAQQRAEAIRNHLVKSGISAERILMSWTGATDFMAENTTEKGRAMNRRVEVQMMQQPVASRN
jgi:flagellar motor protein MotB